MLWRRKKKVHIKIEFKKDTKEIEIVCEPTGTRPTELIQILLYAINTIDMAVKKELGKASNPKKEKKRSLSYIG